MDTVSYVNKVGIILNDTLKYSIDMDRISIKNLILIDHFDKLLTWMKNNKNPEYEINESDIKLIERFILCLKKEVSVYPEKMLDNDCILTETHNKIIQE